MIPVRDRCRLTGCAGHRPTTSLMQDHTKTASYYTPRRAQNRIWLAIAALAADLLAWCARLALPAQVATYEPKRLRLRIVAVVGRIVRTARRRLLKIGPAWPWADVITTAHARLIALPAP